MMREAHIRTPTSEKRAPIAEAGSEHTGSARQGAGSATTASERSPLLPDLVVASLCVRPTHHILLIKPAHADTARIQRPTELIKTGMDDLLTRTVAAARQRQQTSARARTYVRTEAPPKPAPTTTGKRPI